MTLIKPKYLFASVMGLGYNMFLLYPRPITLAKRYLWFYRPYTFYKTSKFLYLIFAVFIPFQLY